MAGKGKPGPPPKLTVDDATLNKIEGFASRGLTKEQIAHNLEISYETLNEYSKKYPEISDVIKRGRSKGVAQVANSLFDRAMKGNVTAMIFFLKNRSPSEWKDRVPEMGPDGEELPTAITVTIQKPNAEPKPE